jgi:hypothetical protein
VPAVDRPPETGVFGEQADDLTYGRRRAAQFEQNLTPNRGTAEAPRRCSTINARRSLVD